MIDYLNYLQNIRGWLLSFSKPKKKRGQENSFFSPLMTPMCHYGCRIPELTGRRIRGCFHGWVILSNDPHNVMWCLWNPLTSKIIRLPPLILEDGDSESIGDCCLSFPPDDPNSVILLTRTDRSTFVFCRLDRKRKNLRWIEMSYSKQLKKISSDGDLLYNLTCCNGKVYALNTDGFYARFVIQIDIVVKAREVVIKLMLFGVCPSPRNMDCYSIDISYLKGSGTELFCVGLGFKELSKDTLGIVSLFKLDMTGVNCEIMEGLKDWDMTRMTLEELDDDDKTEDRKFIDMSHEMWEEMVDLKDAIFFVDLARNYSVYYSFAIASELGGYVHIRSETGKVIHSYDFKDKTISLSSMPSPVLPTSHLLVWECNRLEDDNVETKCTVDSTQEKDEIVVRKSVTDAEVRSNESYLLNLPFDMLEMIMKLCVGVDYMNFRATCKRCHLAAPETPITRLQTYSPWLMVLDIDRRIINLTNPMLCDKYFIKNLPEWIKRFNRICCYNYGWILLYNDDRVLVFYNPFTCEIRRLPDADSTIGILCFSAPPTSFDCMVVGFTETNVYIHFVAREPSWHKLRLNFGQVALYSCCFRTFHGRDIYFLSNMGQLYVYKDLGEYYSLERGETPTRSLSKYFLMNCDQNLLLVIVEKHGDSVEIFKLNDSSKEWETINGLGSHMIYISDETCICIEAKSREMENKIYFSRFDSEKERMVFYSLETRMYHTFNGKSIDKTFRDFNGTSDRGLYLNAWIEPTWS